MNFLIVAGIIIGAYFLARKPRETAVPIAPAQLAPVIAFSTTTPVPIGTEPGFGKTIYTFNISIRWANVDPVSDIINFTIGNDIIASMHPRASAGSQLMPVEVETVPGGSRRLAAIVKNIAGVEYIKAAAYEDINFGAWA